MHFTVFVQVRNSDSESLTRDNGYVQLMDYMYSQSLNLYLNTHTHTHIWHFTTFKHLLTYMYVFVNFWIWNKCTAFYILAYNIANIL